jgi:two-component system sensor histidine kinase/response regulator
MVRIPRVFVGWNVLLADDENDSLEVATRLLKLAGANVITANNGKEVLETIQKSAFTFKFILTDLSMPDMDGWELLYQMQHQRLTLDIPIIALTAHAMSGDRERGIKAGFHNYITKPLEPTKFIQQLVNLLMDVPELAPLLTA